MLAVVALLMTIAAPRYVEHVERARETALRTDLKVMREAIDKFEGDQGRLPTTLEDLVARRYLKEVPVDPITDKRDTWIVVTAAEFEQTMAASNVATTTSSPEKAPMSATNQDGVADVHSGAEGKAKDGTTYREW